MKTGARQNNIELLRIISMLFVLLFHINLNVILRNPETSETLNYVAIAGNAVVAIAVNCFVLISGYFGIRIKLRSFVGLFIQTEYYSFLVSITAIIFLNCHYSMLSGLLPFHPSGLWFIPVYVILYLISPILNEIVKNRRLHRYCIIVILIISFIAYGGGKYEGYSIMNFVLLYLLGRLYKLHPTIVSTKTICYLLFFSVCLTFVLNIIGINLFGMKISTKYFWAYCSPWILATSSMILILFSRLKIGECKLITYLASSSLSVYLLHENSLINSYTYIKPLRYLETKIDNDFIFVLSLFCYACLLYLLVSFIDILRQNVQTFILNSFEKNKYYSIVNGKILKIFNK